MERYIEDSLAAGRISSSASPARACECEFHHSTIFFLGYVIAAGNNEINSDKIRSVVDWPQPTSRVQLNRFLGFAHFYHRFIWCYSTLAFPLSALTSPKVLFTWSPAADQAFSDLMHRLTTAPILVHPDPSCQFVVEVVASDVRVGAILFQHSAQDQKDVSTTMSGDHLRVHLRLHCVDSE
jgi:hypothetical protein